MPDVWCPFNRSLPDLITAVSLIVAVFCLWMQAPSEQGSTNARETTDQQRGQEKEAY